MKRPRISLRTALILLTLVGVGCGLVARWLARAERQRVARVKLEASGNSFTFDFGKDESGLWRSEPLAPRWLINLVGLDAIYPVRIDIADGLQDPSVLDSLKDVHLTGVTAYLDDNADEMVQFIAQQPSINYLSLHGVNDSDLAHLADMPQLVELVLSGEKCTGSGLSRLKAPLHELEIDCPLFGDKGICHVSRFTALRTLYVQSESITDRGMQCMSALVHLRSLVLTLPHVTDKGLQALIGFSELRYMDLRGDQIGAQDLSWLSGLSGLRSLTLHCGATDTTLPQIAALKGLKALWLAGPVQATGKGMSRLRNMNALEHLIAPPGLFSDDSMPAIGEMRSVGGLILDDSEVTDLGLAHLTNMKSLKGLSLANTRITDDGLRTLVQMPNLVEVNLRGCNVTPAGIRQLRRPGLKIFTSSPAKPGSMDPGM